jgi:adenosylcobinamide-phosphate synthase
MQALMAPLALIVERVFGYSPFLVRLIGHPVIWMGWLIDWMDVRFNGGRDAAIVRRNGGVLMLAALLAATLIATLLVLQVTHRVPYGWVLDAAAASALLAQRELGLAVRAVADALEVSLEDGRRAVSRIVGRDPDALDEAGVSRAAIESLAESSCDGVVAPLFYLVLFGLPGIAIYKAVNTADSMVGHLSPRFRHFGWASARLDDLLNWIPARLTALLIAGAAAFTTGADAERAWATALRDAKGHDSPNAGWPEAAMAGALDFSLGGARSYEGTVVDLPGFGRGRRDLGPADIRRALDLYAVLLNLLLGATIVIALAQWRAWG